MRVETRSSVDRGRNGRCTSSTSLGRRETRSLGSYRQGDCMTVSRKRADGSLRPFLRNFIYLALLLAVFKVYRIEERAFQGRAFQMLVTLALAALPVHYMAPFRLKKPLFVAISIVGLFCVFGASRGDRARPGDGLDRHLLPAHPMDRQVGIDGGSGAGPGPARTGLPHAVIPDNVLPIVASMFMFRMLIYLYELKHVKTRETLVDTLGYFFLLPNYCFMHFPVVDYRTMQRGYFAEDVHALQRRGLQMMLRGTVHLLFYRLVYHEMLIPARRVHDLASLSGYLVCNYLLYLQVSGQFHIACGMLQLFGFQLPETHHHYLLATGFTDYWRRINIYWKDFMVRVFFNPVVFRLKRWPQPSALAIGHRLGLSGHMDLACLPVVLAAGKLGFLGSRRSLLGDPGRIGDGECAA